MDMFNLEIKSKLIILLLLFSCSKQNDKNEIFSFPYIEKKIIDSKFIYNELLDSILLWKYDSLLVSKPYLVNDSWKIDDLIILSSDSTRIFATMMRQKKTVPADGLEDLAGAKINGKWYFFFGTSTVIDRATYQDSIYSPLTFDELSYLARKNLSGAFTKDHNGEIKVRDDFFDFMDDPNGWGLPPGSTRADIDSVIVARNKEMHSRKIDPAEIEHIKAEMAKSVRPKEPEKQLKWHEHIFPPKKKLFETDEWKEYIKSRNPGK